MVRPQLGENIGMAARAMLNCGLATLRLVAPRDGWPNDKAQRAFGSVWAAPPNAVPGVGGAPAAQSMSVGLAVAGGVGLLFGQWAKARGYKVIGTVSSPEKAALAKKNGYKWTIDYSKVNIVEQVRKITKGK